MCKRKLVVPLIACVLLYFSVQSLAIAQAPSGADQLFARAVRLHQSGDYEGAIREYNSLLAIDPNRADALSNLGAAYAALGRYQEAIKEYGRALVLDSQNQSYQFNLALAYYKSADITNAAASLSKIIAAHPDNRNALLLLSDCHLRLGDYKKVVDLLLPLEQSSADDPTLDYLLGSALTNDNQIERGQIYIDRILRNGDSAEARVMMGTGHLLAREYPAAIKEFQRALELNPRLPTVHSLYGRALLAVGDREAGMREFRLEIEQNPNDFDSNVYLGSLLKQDDKFDEALAYLERARMLRPSDLNVQYYTGSIYVALGRFEDARQILKNVVKEAPDFVEAHVSLATAYYRLKRKEDGDREKATILRLNAERQAATPGAQPGLGPAYRGEGPALPQKPAKPPVKPEDKQP
jgi:tetratricopeptide (TPR) repeat protein